MARRSSRRQQRGRRAAGRADDDDDDVQEGAAAAEGGQGGEGGGDAARNERSVASHIRDRQRAIAEREASRLARPERRPAKSIGHADRKKSAVSSTPFGVLAAVTRNAGGGNGKRPGDGDGDDDDEEEWCGPFSVARQFIAKREEAKRKREENGEHHPLDEAMRDLANQRRKREHPSVQWKSSLPPAESSSSSSSSLYAKRRKRADVLSRGNSGGVPTLYQMCVDYLVENFEYAEALGDGVDSSIRSSICSGLISKNKMNAQSFRTLCADAGTEALEIVDCSEITQDLLSEALRDLLPGGLKYLALDQSGRCFGPKVVQAIVRHYDAISDEKDADATEPSSPSSSSGNRLFALSVGGAYLLADQDASRLLRAVGPTISSLEFKACPMIKHEFCKSFAENFRPSSSSDAESPNDDEDADAKKSPTSTAVSIPKSSVGPAMSGKSNLLEVSLEDLSIGIEGLNTLTSGHCSWMNNLKSLAIRRIDGVDDQIIGRMLKACGPSLEKLDLSHCYGLTDNTLASIRRYCCDGAGAGDGGRLRDLHLAGLRLLTSEGLQALFTHVPDASPPPMLRVLDLGCCDYEAVTDDVVQLAAQASVAKTGTLRAAAASYYGNDAAAGLSHVDVQGSALLTDASMEYLVAACPSSLRDLNVSFCTALTDNGLGYLVDKCGTQLSKLQIWGCAQLSDDFLDGHTRVDDPSLEIAGAWMKKNSVRAIR